MYLGCRTCGRKRQHVLLLAIQTFVNIHMSCLSVQMGVSAFQMQNVQMPLGKKRHQCRNDQSVNNMKIEELSSEANSNVLGRKSFVGLVSSMLFIPLTASAAEGKSQAKRNNSDGNNVKQGRSVGGLPKRIRSICVIMDELQRDLMEERWDLLDAYPIQLRSFVPIFTSYADSAFPGEDPIEQNLRVALRYEANRFFGGIKQLKKTLKRKDLDDAYTAYSNMAIHFDRFLRVGSLYDYYDPIEDYSKLYEGIPSSALVYKSPKRDPPGVRDLVVMVQGPDKGRIGILIGILNDGSNDVVVKLDKYSQSSGIRPIKVVPKLWAGKRLGEQEPDAAFLIPRS